MIEYWERRIETSPPHYIAVARRWWHDGQIPCTGMPFRDFPETWETAGWIVPDTPDTPEAAQQTLRAMCLEKLGACP